MNDISQRRRDLYRLAGRDPSEYDNHVLLDICTACGADCVYCLHQAANLAPSKTMRRADFLLIADMLQREGYGLVYLYQSGESFLHPDYYDFLVEIAERGMDSNTATKLFMPIKGAYWTPPSRAVTQPASRWSSSSPWIRSIRRRRTESARASTFGESSPTSSKWPGLMRRIPG